MRRNPFRLALVGAVLLAAPVGAQSAGAQEPAKQPTARGTGGAAATVDVLATQAAVDVLDKGGNAVDAAVAAAGVLGVTEPFSCGIGGGGFMVIRTAKGKVTTLDGREKSPATMRPDSFWENGSALKFNDARFSGISAGIPGTPATWDRALRKYGTLTLKQALLPGRRVARDGFVIDQTFFNSVNAIKQYFDDIPSTAAIYLDPDGTPRDVGTRIANPDMAKTYRIMSRDGVKKGFYSGPVADAMAKAASQPPTAATADHTWRPGLMTTTDLARYKVRERDPIKSSYRGLTVYGMGPPSSGGTTVAEALNILGGYTPAGANRTQALHRLLEASRYTFADRGAYLADPAFFKVPVRGLVSPSFADERRALIGDTAAKSPVAAGDPYDNQGDTKPGAATASISREQSTTHLVTADRLGNTVSYTFTIESTGGNGVVVPGYGFLLNNELTDFNYDDKTFKTPNRAEGNKRPRSSMSPTIIERDGKPWMSIGSPGGSTIPGTVLQTLVNRIDFKEPLPNAIALPRVVERNTARAQAERAFIDSREGQDLMNVYGHTPFITPDDTDTLGATPEIGATTAIEFRGKRTMIAGAEPVRRGGGAAGVVTPAG
jgi:gamma-glutamyltranspeptidase / glutathione hydrolase